MKKQENLTAAQRLERLEDAVFTVDQALGGVSQILQAVRQATTLLGRKVDAIVTLTEQGTPVTAASIHQAMEDQSVKELQTLVEDFKGAGGLIPSETVTPDSFIVSRETNSETGKVTKARIQFPFADIDDSLKESLIGKTVGSVIKFEGNPFDLEILEIYKIVEINAENPTEQTATPITETA